LILYAKDTLEDLSFIAKPGWAVLQNWRRVDTLKVFEQLALKHLYEDQARVLFGGFQEEIERGELSGLKDVVLMDPDNGRIATAVVEVVRSACEGTGVVVEMKDVSGSSIERPAIYSSYPRKRD
jgi:hypothetical protein